MRISSEKLENHLRQGLAPLYVVLGEEPLLALESLNLLRQTAQCQGFSAREVLTVESGFDWSLLTQACQSGSLFGEKKLVELRLNSGKPGVEGGRRLEGLPRLADPDMAIVVSLPALDYRTQQSGWFQALESQGVLIHAALVTREQLPSWITQRLSRQQQEISRDALAFLCERVEGNLLAAHQEIQKLGLLFPAGLLPDQDVRDAVLQVGRYSAPDLSLALFSGDLPRFTRTLRGLQGEGEPLPLVLWSVTEDLRALIHLTRARQQRRPLAAAFKEARVWGPRQKLLEPLSSILSPVSCERALVMAAAIDRMIKGVDPGDPWDSLLELGLWFQRQRSRSGARLA
ncbi:MAG: DNA polymerase III subunit delta [Betaproteobacteria bacterium]|nr:DNA polymerase III subunit delta [Betaproteobacteria bacterium]